MPVRRGFAAVATATTTAAAVDRGRRRPEAWMGQGPDASGAPVVVRTAWWLVVGTWALAVVTFNVVGRATAVAWLLPVYGTLRSLGVRGSLADPLLHVGGFTVLGCLVRGALGPLEGSGGRRRLLDWLLLTWAFGVVVELQQTMVAARGASVPDAAANLAGGALGLVALPWTVQALRARRPGPPAGRDSSSR